MSCFEYRVASSARSIQVTPLSFVFRTFYLMLQMRRFKANKTVETLVTIAVPTYRASLPCNHQLLPDTAHLFAVRHLELGYTMNSLGKATVYSNNTQSKTRSCAVAQLESTTSTDLAEGERRAADLFNAEKMQRIDDSYCVDDAVDCPYLVKMHLLVKWATAENQHAIPGTAEYTQYPHIYHCTANTCKDPDFAQLEGAKKRPTGTWSSVEP